MITIPFFFFRENLKYFMVLHYEVILCKPCTENQMKTSRWILKRDFIVFIVGTFVQKF